MATSRPDVSVIVPVRDGLPDILELLECLRRQTLAPDRFELVVGDDGSTDGLPGRLGFEDGRVRVASGPAANSYAARHRAVAASRGRVLAFCDSDCRPEPEWLDRGLAGLEGTDLAAGRIRFAIPAAPSVWSLVDMDGSKDHEHLVRVGVAETANLFLRRELYDRVGGFDGSIPEYGDYEFVERCIAAGAKLSFAREAVVWHPVRTSGRSLLRALWKYNRGYAVHAGRRGDVAEAVKLRSWVPLVQTIRSRRRWGRSWGPDRAWLGSNGVVPTRLHVFLALPIMYVVLPYLAAISQLLGWLEGRRLRRERAEIRSARGQAGSEA